MKIQIENTNWQINDEIYAMENPSKVGYFLIAENEVIKFQNVDILIEAINNARDIFSSVFHFHDIDKSYLEFINCLTCPVTLKQTNRIGLLRTQNSYEQDLYQLSHELMHMCLSNTIPKEYSWFEESLCALSSLIVLDIMYQKFSSVNSEKAYNIKYFNICNCIPKQETKEINLSVFFHKLMPVLSSNRNFEKVCALFMEPILRDHNYNMSIFKTLPSIPKSNFLDYLQEWVDGSDEDTRDFKICIRNIFLVERKN